MQITRKSDKFSLINNSFVPLSSVGSSHALNAIFNAPPKIPLNRILNWQADFLYSPQIDFPHQVWYIFFLLVHIQCTLISATSICLAVPEITLVKHLQYLCFHSHPNLHTTAVDTSLTALYHILIFLLDSFILVLMHHLLRSCCPQRQLPVYQQALTSFSDCSRVILPNLGRCELQPPLTQILMTQVSLVTLSTTQLGETLGRPLFQCGYAESIDHPRGMYQPMHLPAHLFPKGQENQQEHPISCLHRNRTPPHHC